MIPMQIIGTAGMTVEVTVKDNLTGLSTHHVVAKLLTGTQLTEGLMKALTLQWQAMGADLPLSLDDTARIVAAHHVPDACPEQTAGRN